MRVSGKGRCLQPSISVLPDVLSWCLVPKVMVDLLSFLGLFSRPDAAWFLQEQLKPGSLPGRIHQEKPTQMP